jgi:hypothetical protein
VTSALARCDTVVVESQKLDGCACVAVVPDVERRPTRIRINVMRPGAPSGHELVTNAAGIRDVGLVPTVHVPDRAVSDDEVRLREVAGPSSVA